MTSLVAVTPRRAVWLWLIPLTLLGLLIGSLAQTPLLAPGGPGTAQDRAAIGRAIRLKEPEMRRAALKTFPGDTWSQGDDFSHEERQFVLDEAAARGMRPGAVLEAIDRDVRAFPGPERAQVPPCTPRPFYD